MEAKVNSNNVLRGDELLKRYQLRMYTSPANPKAEVRFSPEHRRVTTYPCPSLDRRFPSYSTLQASTPFLLYGFYFPFFETFLHALFSTDLET